MLLHAAGNYFMMSGVIGNMSGICWTNDINLHQGTNLFFQLEISEWQNPKWWNCMVLPLSTIFGMNFSRWLWHEIISFLIRMNFLKIIACIYTDGEAFHQLSSLQSHINNSLVSAYVMSAYFTISYVSWWRMRHQLLTSSWLWHMLINCWEWWVTNILNCTNAWLWPNTLTFYNTTSTFQC